MEPLKKIRQFTSQEKILMAFNINLAWGHKEVVLFPWIIDHKINFLYFVSIYKVYCCNGVIF